MAVIPQRTISQFKSKLIGGGARPNLFEVQVNFPDGVDLGIQGDGGGEFDGDRFRFLCKAAQLPASYVGNLEVPFRGRVMKVAGDRTFDPWSVTVINDQVTRANFINIVEPYLRDVEAKRGLYGFLVICDETNNTPDIIDNNEFRADIFLKPAKSINYVTLTFVATRTVVSFEEVAGRV